MSQGKPILDADLAALLASTPETTDEMRASVKLAGAALARDWQFKADLAKGYFVIKVLAAMEEQGLTKSDLARLLGCTRQNVSKLLDEEEPANFTLETLFHVSEVLGITCEMHMLGNHESAHVLRCRTQRRDMEAGIFAHRPKSNILIGNFVDFRSTRIPAHVEIALQA